MRFIIVPEYISCILLALIGVYLLSDKRPPSVKGTIYQIGLFCAILANINNIISIYALENPDSVPLILSVVTNTMYFFAVAVMTTMISITTFATMFEGRYEERRLKHALVLSICLFLLEVILVLSNFVTGWLFYFDADKQYHRGPLNAVGLVFLAIAVFNVLLFGLLERKRLKKSFRMIMYTLPAIGIVMGVVQFLFQYTILTGTIIGFSLLTLFISGQQQRAQVDALTELPSREAFFSDISRICAKRQSYQIILVALRNFKQINGQFGQRAGDAFLFAVARYLTLLDPRVTAYRTSGVQFTMVVAKMDCDEYKNLFDKLIERFQQCWQTEHGSSVLHALFADICYPEHAGTVDEIVASLEYATKIAKLDIAGRPVRFSEAMKDEFSRRNYVISQMQKALEEDAFFLNIQPVYDIRQQRFTGGEVLLRLNEDNGMPISPGEFIPLAIETRIATRLGLMVMEKVCRFLHDNQDVNLGWLSINISSQQDEFDATVQYLEKLLEQYGVEPRRIKLEITEMVLLDDLERAHATMDELNKRGIGVYLDDFGTGYSNLVNVMTLPFECVKIDKGFIRGIANNPKSCGMLETLVSGLRRMNVVALAEGVETQEQDNIVRELGIDRIQGYYYARPMPADEFVWLIRQHSTGEAKLTTDVL